jgi:uncharacterized protein (DUF983 family)
MNMTLAQAGIAGQIGWMAIVGIVIAGIIGIALVVARATGIAIPNWVIQILWIIFAVVVGVLAIKLVLSVL